MKSAYITRQGQLRLDVNQGNVLLLFEPSEYEVLTVILNGMIEIADGFNRHYLQQLLTYVSTENRGTIQ